MEHFILVETKNHFHPKKAKKIYFYVQCKYNVHKMYLTILKNE